MASKKMLMNYHFSAASLVGGPPNNEDALALSYPRFIHVSPPSPLPVSGSVEVDRYSTFFCALADGMGGHAKGEVASQTAVMDALQNLHLFPLAALKKSMERLHRTVRAASFGSGTTLTVAAVHLRTGNGLVASVGDTRPYLYRAGALRQLCSDHNEAGAAARHGLHTGGRRNVLLQCIGGQEDPPDVELAAFTLRPRDMLLLATDGAHEPVGDDGIREVLEGWWNRPRNVAQDLCARAVGAAGPGVDNATAVVVARMYDGSAVSADFDDVRTLASPWS